MVVLSVRYLSFFPRITPATLSPNVPQLISTLLYPYAPTFSSRNFWVVLLVWISLFPPCLPFIVSIIKQSCPSVLQFNYFLQHFFLSVGLPYFDYAWTLFYSLRSVGIHIYKGLGILVSHQLHYFHYFHVKKCILVHSVKCLSFQVW